MPVRWVGMVVVSDKVTVVDVEVPRSGPLVLQADDTWRLQGGNRAIAYGVMHRRVLDYVRAHEVDRVIIKESAVSRQVARKALLEAAELRGVVMCAAAAAVDQTETMAKALISRTFGDRKVDEYLQDNAFWSAQVDGVDLRIGSREAAMVLVAARGRA